MADKTPVLYTEVQEKSIRWYIPHIFGEKKSRFTFYEFESEYVHIDFMSAGFDERALVTVGVGAREMNSPVPDADRIELAMHMRDRSAEMDDDVPSADEAIIAAELARLGRYPFKCDTWFAPGHIIDASEEFEKAFGYKHFLLMLRDFDEYPVKGLGKVRFLSAAPIYEDEHEWMMNNEDGVCRFYLELYGLIVFEDTLLCVDNRRDLIIPPDPGDGEQSVKKGREE